MKDPEIRKSINYVVRLSPNMLGLISEEARRRRMTVCDFMRYCTLSSIRQAHSEPHERFAPRA